jgi:hypothetical protein
MSGNNPEYHRKTSVLDKIGQKITNIKEDIADNIERRKQSHSNISTNQVHFASRTSMTDESSVIEKKPPTPPESHLRRPSTSKNRKRKYIYKFTFDKRRKKR